MECVCCLAIVETPGSELCYRCTEAGCFIEGEGDLC